MNLCSYYIQNRDNDSSEVDVTILLFGFSCSDWMQKLNAAKDEVSIVINLCMYCTIIGLLLAENQIDQIKCWKSHKNAITTLGF